MIFVCYFNTKEKQTQNELLEGVKQGSCSGNLGKIREEDL